MKMYREKKPDFEPIIIVLETEEEAEYLHILLDHAADIEEKDFKEMDEKYGDDWYYKLNEFIRR